MQPNLNTAAELVIFLVSYTPSISQSQNFKHVGWELKSIDNSAEVKKH